MKIKNILPLGAVLLPLFLIIGITSFARPVLVSEESDSLGQLASEVIEETSLPQIENTGEEVVQADESISSEPETEAQPQEALAESTEQVASSGEEDAPSTEENEMLQSASEEPTVEVNPSLVTPELMLEEEIAIPLGTPEAYAQLKELLGVTFLDTNLDGIGDEVQFTPEELWARVFQDMLENRHV